MCQPAAAFKASPRSLASCAESSTTRRPPPSSGTRITMPRPSLVTSSGPSPVRGFMAAIEHLFLNCYLVTSAHRQAEPVAPLPRRAGMTSYYPPTHPSPGHGPLSGSALPYAARPGRASRTPQQPREPAMPDTDPAPVPAAAGSSDEPGVLLAVADGVATITLNRPGAMNS